MTLLDVVLFLPLVGFFLLLILPEGNPAAWPRWSSRSQFSSCRWDC